jgi:hypothetical protein
MGAGLGNSSLIIHHSSFAADGKKYRTKLFNLHMILAVGGF